MFKLPKLIMKKEKGKLQALGLHHAGLTALAILIGHLLGFGDFMAAAACGVYFRNEWGSQLKPPETFEYMDFIAPVVVAILYLSVT